LNYFFRSDPSEELRELSVKTGKQLIEVAMGQGQAVFAVEMLHQAAQKGDWLCLKNLHLMTFWISILEKELQSLSLHDDFRLWLTAESHSKFPATLAESCLKVTYESPPGIKRNLQRTLNGWGAKVLESSDSVARAQAVFALAWFHAVVQERRIFIPQGWCKFYEFSDGDLKAGLEVLDQLSKANSSSLDWGTIHGLYSNAIYGGRVDDVHDIRILVSYLQDMFNPEVIAGTARSKSTLGPIELPVTNSFASYLDIVNKLPEDDKPSMFGLPANIQQSYQRTRSTLTINQLRTLMRSLPGASKFEREKWHNELNPVLNLWKKLNQGSTLLQMKMIAPAEESISDPIKAFVQLEFYNAVNLIQFIHKSMASLVKVIRGSQLLDEKVSQLAESLMGQETPGKWQKMWDGPEDPMVYLKAVVDKATAVQKWNSSVERGNLLNSEVDLSDLFNPGTFLGALRQRTAREYKISMDELKFSNSWSRGGVANAKIPVKVTGIMIEGAVFDGVRMSECAWDSPTYSAAPTSTFAWIPKSNSDHYRPNEAIRLPLYNTNERDKILTFVHVPSGGEENKWLQAGAVLFLDDQL
jgi:dynein heavy chain 2